MLKTSRTVTADVLVIGGGGAACTAAVAAARAGASVVLVSKGKAGNSGNTIMIGGSYGMDGESAYYDYHIPGAAPSFTKESLFPASSMKSRSGERRSANAFRSMRRPTGT